MTLEKRLNARLQQWRADLERRRYEWDRYENRSEEWWLSKMEVEMLERCVTELASDLMARNVPTDAELVARLNRSDAPSSPR